MIDKSFEGGWFMCLHVYSKVQYAYFVRYTEQTHWIPQCLAKECRIADSDSIPGPTNPWIRIMLVSQI